MSQTLKYSICIPNFNYGHLIGQTISSVLNQECADLEVLVSDNASTDNSVAVVEAMSDARLHLKKGSMNVGFAGNLDKAAAFAVGDFLILLSSDDIMGPVALKTYNALHAFLGESAPRCIVASSAHVIDGDGLPTGFIGMDRKLWRGAAVDEHLSAVSNATVWRIPALELLQNCLQLLRTPFPFLTTCYSRELYEQVGGYAGKGLINPDKWFAYKLLAEANFAYFVNAPLFSYRVHSGSQSSQQLQSGSLKHLMDQYALTFDLPDAVLEKAGTSRILLAKAFIHEDICLRALIRASHGERQLARRMLNFGRAAYPVQLRSNPWGWLLKASLLLGPIGTLLLSSVRKQMIAGREREAVHKLDAREALRPSEHLRNAA